MAKATSRLRKGLPLNDPGSLTSYMQKKQFFLGADGCSERASEFSMQGYQLKPSDGRKLNFSIKEHRAMVEKLKVLLKDVKEHDSTLFQSNGLALKQGEETAHS